MQAYPKAVPIFPPNMNFQKFSIKILHDCCHGEVKVQIFRICSTGLLPKMSARKIIFKALDANAVIPKRQTSGAAGYDIHTIAAGVVPPKQIVSIRTGFFLRIPLNLCGIILGRSGLAIKFGLEIKASYVKNGEEVVVHVYNHGEVPFSYDKSMRIAQLIFSKIDTDAEYVPA